MSRKFFVMLTMTAMSLVISACAGTNTSDGLPTSDNSAITVTVEPTKAPEVTAEPTTEPTEAPEATAEPTTEPTEAPEVTAEPTEEPTVTPEVTTEPTVEPTEAPEVTAEPTAEPTEAPEVTAEPTEEPTVTPEVTTEPTKEPTKALAEPTKEPTKALAEPTKEPTKAPTATVKPTETPKPTATPMPEDNRKMSGVKVYSGTTVAAETAKKGDVIFFGAYEQDGNTGNGVEQIAWKVLEKDGNRLLLLSVSVLDVQAFHSTAADVSWEKSDIKSWLQKEFYETAFSAKEQSDIVTVDAGTVFLLSFEEVQRYFSVESSKLHLQELTDKRLVAAATEYAKNLDVWSLDGGVCWWLRSTGQVAGTAVEITEDGSIYRLGTEVNYSFNGVRPAIWLEFH